MAMGREGPDSNTTTRVDSALQFTSAGVLAMANSGVDTNGSQFFITADETRWLDFRYTIFGFLTEGDSIRRAIDGVSTDSNTDKPVNTVTMTSVTTFTDTQNGVLRLSAPVGTTGSADVTVTGHGQRHRREHQSVVLRDRLGRHQRCPSLPRSHRSRAGPP